MKENLVDKMDIQNYARRNTSKKMPIEEKYVQAFLDSMLNSSALKEKIQILSDETQNGDAFLLFTSYDVSAQNINKEPFRSILAYSMLKKDFRLFELISASMFTGTVAEYHGTDLYITSIKETDESPVKYTDEGGYTDMTEGLIQIGFKNIFSTEVLEDGAGSEYQTLNEMLAALDDFNTIITLCKPARVEVLIFFEPYCYLSGNQDVSKTINVKDDVYFSSPFGDRNSMDIIDNMTDYEVTNLYQAVSYFNYETNQAMDIDSERHITRGDGFIMFTYEFRINAQGNHNPIWYHILIESDSSHNTYVKSTHYEEDKEYYERYIPIMLRINDNDPTGPILAFEVDHDVGTIGAMFYIRDKED